SPGTAPSCVIKLWECGVERLQGFPQSMINTFRNERPNAIAADNPAKLPPMMITSNWFMSVILLNFENTVNGKGKANAVNASPPCFMISRLVILLLIYMSFGKGSLKLIFLSNKFCSLSCNKHFSKSAIILCLSISCLIYTILLDRNSTSLYSSHIIISYV